MDFTDCQTIGAIIERLGEMDMTPNSDQRAALQRAAEIGTEWQPIEKHDKSSKHCLVAYYNGADEARVIKAFYAKRYTIEHMGEDDGVDEYCEEKDDYYLLEGWYEVIDNWPDYAFVRVCEGEPTHWKPLPTPPTKENGNGK